jgi:hypothetical protein
VVDGLPGWEVVWQQSPLTATLEHIEDGLEDLTRRGWIRGGPLALGVGRWDSRQLHWASERSLWYAFLMLGILPSECLRTPFQTVS